MQHVTYLYSKLQKQTVKYTLSAELCSAAEAPRGKIFTGARKHQEPSSLFSLPLYKKLSNYYLKLCMNVVLRKKTIDY